MHHMFDETPNEPSKIPGYLPTVTHSDARFTTHFGKVATENEGQYKEQVDTSQYRLAVWCLILIDCLIISHVQQTTRIQSRLSNDWT